MHPTVYEATLHIISAPSRSIHTHTVHKLRWTISYEVLSLLSKQTKQTPWSESASELYRPSDRRLSAKLVPTFANRGVSRGQSDGSLTAEISVF
jgi:hypothetical protein